uniref:Thioesterase domain-containing protein n=1 Tax=Mycena chlorophos TaxID=658473 RepID=A0ABQ0LWA8_MYCCL|nr:predicted protein [Mycena chlorophos]
MSSPSSSGSSKPKPVNRDRHADNTARLAKLLEIPPVPWSHDIRGNPPQADKDLIASVFAFFIQGGIMPEAFGKDVGGRVKMVEMNVVEDGRGTEGFWEVEVTQDMCNAFGTMHGACAAFLVDHTTIGTMVFLGRVRGFDGIGMTTNLNLHWHSPANVGDVLSIYARSVFADKAGRGTRVARCEIREKSKGRLVVSATAGGVATGFKL